MLDRLRVSVEFKISKSYNSIGGSVAYESEQKPEESLDEFFDRVYKTVDDKLNIVFKDADKALDKISS